MQIEIVKFYEIERQDEKQFVLGTLHIRLPEIGLNVRGITVYRKKKFWHFRLPSRKAFDKILNKEIDYTCLLFDGKEKNEAIISFLQTAGREYVENYLSSTAEASKIEAVSKPLESINQDEGVGIHQKSEDLKQEPSNEVFAKPEPIKAKSKLETMEFKDPPPRKQAFARTDSKFARR